MNLWWFRLYSLKVMEQSLKWAGIGLVLDQLIGRSLFLDSWGAALIFLPFYPLIRKPMSNQFRSNLEFHKMNVSFSELKKAYFFHTTLVFLMAYVLTLASYLVSRYFGGVHSNVNYDLLQIVNSSYILYFHFAGFVAYLSYSQSEPLKRKYQFMSQKKNDLAGFLYGIGAAAFFFFTALGMMFYLDTTIIPFTAAFLTFALASWLYVNRAIFHKVPERATIGANLKYLFLGIFIFFGLYFVCLLPGRDDVLNPSLSKVKRLSSYSYNGRFNPPIDIETFKALEPQIVLFDLGDDLLYSKIDFDPSSLGIEYFIDDKRSTRLLSLIQHGKVSSEFLIALYDHFEAKPDYWKDIKDYPVMRYYSFQKWPKKEKLPERFIAARLDSKEVFDNLYKRKERVPASKSSSR